MKSIELVTHCWATELPHYAAALCYQLSSLVLNKPTRCKVSVTICCEPSDARTLAIIPFFQEALQIKTLWMRDAHELGRRSIGRNMAAKASKANIVWFTDVDYLFGRGCLDALASLPWPDGAAMIYPEDGLICKDHDTGDRLLARIADRVCVIDTYLEDFIMHHHSRAIGGIQIVQGDFARKHGYLDGEEKWQMPAKKPFDDFRDDIAYRNFCKRHGKIVPVDLPEMRRLRHSQTTYQ